MFSVFKKSMALGALSFTFCLTSCGNASEKRAESYLNEARQLQTQERFSEAISLLDSLDTFCSDCIDRRREGMRLRPALMEGASLQEIARLDSLIAALSLESEQYKAKLTHVKDAFEGYYTSPAIAGKVPARKSGLYARMSPDGVLTVIASSTKLCGSEGVTLSAAGSQATTPRIANDGERNDRSRGVEIITFMPVECDTLGHFAALNRGNKITLTFDGAKPYSMTLDAVQAEALADVYEASVLAKKVRLAHLEKVKAEKQLQVARNQMARSFGQE